MKRATNPGATLLAVVGTAALCAVVHANRGLAAETSDSVDLKEQSLGWYILSQTDANDFLHGLPQRLGLAANSDKVEIPARDATDVAGTVTVEYDGEMAGDLSLGLFADARFFVAPPVAVYRLPGPGRHELRLPIGDWSVGAMLGPLPRPTALGVDQNWPEPVHVVAGERPVIHVLVSPKFQARPANVPQLEDGFASLWKPVDPHRLAIVRTLDSNDTPSPFNRITFVDRDERETRSFHEVGTDHLGYAYCDAIDGTFSIMPQRFDVLPRLFLTRWHLKRLSKLYDARDRPVIEFRWNDFPRGTGRIVGQVHDQHGRPLTEYFLTLTRQIGERLTWTDSEIFAFKKAVVDPEGLFDMRDLLPGEYTAMIRHFDCETHVWTFDGPKVVVPATPDALVEAEWEVEAKDCFYGRVLAADGEPVTAGYWMALDINNQVHADGTFRICLSQAEQAALASLADNRIDIKSPQGERLLRIPLTRLARDPEHPAIVTLK